MIRACRTCRLLRGNLLKTPFAPLPKFRCSTPDKPYTYVGLDFFGPLTVNTTEPTKYYGLIYTCANTRGIQLELTSSIDTKAVMRALRNIFARVGLPELIYSDNGKSFVKADKMLQELMSNARVTVLKEQAYFRNKRLIYWHFQTPLSPWKGGMFERLIRNVKNCLKSMTFAKKYTFEDLQTIMYEVSQILNSRPLFTTDGQVITPAHFTAGRPLIALPPVGGAALKGFSAELMDIVRHQKRVNGFWRQWLKAYLMQLPSVHENPKRHGHLLQVGDIVLLNDPSKDRSVWPIGVVTKVFQSGDGIVRSAEIKIEEDGNEKLVTRSTERMVLLEAADEYLPGLADSDPCGQFGVGVNTRDSPTAHRRKEGDAGEVKKNTV